MTYGQLRLLISKENAGADLDLADGYIQARYTEILDQLPWKRQEAKTVIQAPPSYAIGTITTVQGSNAIVGLGTSWTAAMNGLMIRIACQNEFYQFTYVSPTAATLDRGYEWPGGTALTYRIDQAVFLLPADCRILRAVTPLHDGGFPLDPTTPHELDQMARGRNTYGTPRFYVQTWDSFSDPPQMQVELSPVPSSPNTAGTTLSWAIDYAFDAAPVDPTQTGISMLPWVRPAALQAAVRADFLRLAKDWTGAEAMDARAGKLVETMLKVNAAQRGPQVIKTAAAFQRLNKNRRHGKWHEGYTG
jgi:hypothetical protein